MTKTNMDLSELLAKHDKGDLLRGIAEAVLQLIMESDVDGLIGAGLFFGFLFTAIGKRGGGNRIEAARLARQKVWL